MSAPKILQLCTRFPPGGIQRHVLDVSQWLRARGWQVAFAGSPGAWMNEAIDDQFFPVNLSDVAQEGGALPRRLMAAHAAARALRAVLKRENFDLIHAHESAPALVARLAAFGMGTPIALTFHGADPKRVREFGMIAKRCADFTLTPSRMSADELARAGGLKRDSIRVIGLGVHHPPAADAGKINALRARLLSGGDTLVVTVARLAHQKAIDHLVAVAARLRDRCPGARYVIVGDGPQRAEAERWISEAGLAGVVALAGRSDAAHEYLAAGDIFFLPSRWESLPITIVEAFRAGLPVVATDTGGVRELVDESVGEVCGVGDLDALAEALGALINDRDRRATRAAAARRRSEEARFDPDAVNATMAAAYREMIGLPPQKIAAHG